MGSSLNMARLRTICSDASPCPAPRRDASVTLIDQREGSSGKLVVFGGVTGLGSAEDWLADDTRFLTALDDFWVLDLDQVLCRCNNLTFGDTQIVGCVDTTEGTGRSIARAVAWNASRRVSVSLTFSGWS